MTVALALAVAATACGPSGNAKASTDELVTRIQEVDANDDLTDAEAECLAEAMRDELPADALEQILGADDVPIEELLAGEGSSALLARTFTCFGDRIGGG